MHEERVMVRDELAIAEPVCPGCEARGREQIAVRPLPHDAMVAVVHCAACGHVYGVVPGVPADPNRESIVRALSGQ